MLTQFYREYLAVAVFILAALLMVGAMLGVGSPSYLIDSGGRATRIPLPAPVDDTSVYGGREHLFAATDSRVWSSPDLGRRWQALVG